MHQIQHGVPRAAWFEAASHPARHIDSLVDWLVQEGYLRVEDPLEEEFTLTEKAAQMMEQWRPRRT
jgi:hypothetical protein